MYVSTLRLLNYRSFRQAEVGLLPGVNLILGRNGQGKTTLLEALATLALTRSPRTSSLQECVSWGEERLGVSALVDSSGRETGLELRAERLNGRWTRRLRRAGLPVPARELLGNFRVVMFWPEDLHLIKGGPEPRRRLLDVVLSQLSQRYLDEANRYRRALEHRNAVLRRLRDGVAARAEMSVWTDALVEHGEFLISQRRQYLAEAEPLARQAAEEIGERSELRLDYRPALGTAEPVADIGAALRAALRLRATEEVARAQTLAGPHRDDFDVLLDGQSARQYASQGQQRTLVLALKVAEVRQHSRRAGEAPVLLLDDVLSELDRDRRLGLVHMLAEGMGVEQTMITATEPGVVASQVPVTQRIELAAGSMVRG